MLRFAKFLGDVILLEGEQKEWRDLGLMLSSCGLISFFIYLFLARNSYTTLDLLDQARDIRWVLVVSDELSVTVIIFRDSVLLDASSGASLLLSFISPGNTSRHGSAAISRVR